MRNALNPLIRLLSLTALLLVPVAARAQANVEQAFCNVVKAAATVYKSAEDQGANELQLSKLRSSRRDALKKAVKNGVVKDWLGVIQELHTNGDGDATLMVALPPCGEGVHLMTWTVGFADADDHTIIKQSSPLYAVLMKLRPGSIIKLSGKFLPSDQDAFKEASVTESGSMREPEFLLLFSLIAKP